MGGGNNALCYLGSRPNHDDDVDSRTLRLYLRGGATLAEFDNLKNLRELTSGGFGMPDIRPQEIRLPVSPLVAVTEANYASEFHKRLVKWINGFDAALDESHEVGARLVSFGEKVIFHLRDINYWNPSLISFVGVTDDGNPVELVQHVSQISILLMKLPRKDSSKPKTPIGFRPES